MHVVTPAEMARIEKLSYQAGASEEEFMERAGRGVADVVQDFSELHHLGKKIALLCGKGNNAGDAYVAGRHLLKEGFEVIAYQLVPIETCSPLCQAKLLQYKEAGGAFAGETPKAERLAKEFDLLLDGVFGTGFRGSLSGPFFNALDAARRSEVPSIAIDIPSGLNGETGAVETVCLPAAATVFLGLPKTGFFLREGWDVVGELHAVDFGLEETFLKEATAPFSIFSPHEAEKLLPPIRRSRHKYEAGSVVGLAGSAEMPGAAKLSCLSALRGGAGLVRLLSPAGILSDAPYELIQHPFEVGDGAFVLEKMNSAHAVFIGPGLGRSSSIEKLLPEILPKIEKPLVIDADALSLLAKHPESIPQGALLTPHAGEMARLLQEETPKRITLDFLERCRAFALHRRVQILLKGGPSWIFSSKGELHVSLAGTPGMATAGSGDVLTGLLAALLSQGCPPHEAALLGAHLHGVAGEVAAEKFSPYCMIASDIINAFPEAFWAL